MENDKIGTLTLTGEQLRLLVRILDLYSRIGIGQFHHIKDHPTFEKHLYDLCIPDKIPEVGDHTPQGEILEIKNGKALINGSVVKGRWNKKKQWKKLSNVKLSTDYNKYHSIRDTVDMYLLSARNLLYGNEKFNTLHGGWGIYNPKVDESCRIAYDIQQVIRHEIWKNTKDRSEHTVDSSVHTSTKDADKIKCEIK